MESLVALQRRVVDHYSSVGSQLVLDLLREGNRDYDVARLRLEEALKRPEHLDFEIEFFRERVRAALIEKAKIKLAIEILKNCSQASPGPNSIVLVSEIFKESHTCKKYYNHYKNHPPRRVRAAIKLAIHAVISRAIYDAITNNGLQELSVDHGVRLEQEQVEKKLRRFVLARVIECNRRRRKQFYC